MSPSDDFQSVSVSDSDRRRLRRRSRTDEPSNRRSRRRNITEAAIAEYLAKKAQKTATKVAKKLESQTVAGYSNDSNPFGDSNLTEKLVWRKKIERDVSLGRVPLDEFSVESEKKRRRERMAEIEKVKRRREERAVEKAQREEEMAMLARERSRAEVHDWEKREDEFEFERSKIRSEIRLLEGRAKPIDVLTRYLDFSDDFDVLEFNEPYIVFRGLSVNELEEVRNEIKMHVDLDRDIRYWEALLVVCESELAERLHRELIGEERGLHMSVETDVRNFLQGKSYGELEALQEEIESQMQSGTAKVVEYWEAVFRRLRIFKARACLKEIHAKMLHKRLEHLESPTEDNQSNKIELSAALDGAEALAPIPVEALEEEEEARGSYSPQLLHDDENEDAIDSDEDKVNLERRRIAVLEERRIQELAAKGTSLDNNFEKNALKAMGAAEEGDAVFGSSDEINLNTQSVYWWHDKYRPRKPKYFNRVHTGYEWNKYNQTHYDHDNPPPKTVHGYKFNIFYPDLVDKSRAPNYTIEKDGDNTETCIIRFHAGPPYEDIAFRIVNKEWEYSHKKGFKCTFERGILHVYFNFKRYRYRR